MKREIILFIIIIIVGIQFIPVQRNYSKTFSKGGIIESTKAPADIAQMLKSSCYDCHSNHTKYPWYNNIAPVSWWIASHISEAKKELNFSEWEKYTLKKKKHKLKEIIEETGEGEMPLRSYLWTHGEVKLSESQINRLETWINSIKE